MAGPPSKEGPPERPGSTTLYYGAGTTPDEPEGETTADPPAGSDDFATPIPGQSVAPPAPVAEPVLNAQPSPAPLPAPPVAPVAPAPVTPAPLPAPPAVLPNAPVAPVAPAPVAPAAPPAAAPPMAAPPTHGVGDPISQRITANGTDSPKTGEMHSAQLRVLKGAPKGRIFTLATGDSFMGRSADCELVLDDKAVSRKHALVRFDGRAVTIADRGSGNGTRVNGERVKSQVLNHWDIVRLGRTHMRFEWGGMAGPMKPSAPPKSDSAVLSPPTATPPSQVTSPPAAAPPTATPPSQVSSPPEAAPPSVSPAQQMDAAARLTAPVPKMELDELRSASADDQARREEEDREAPTKPPTPRADVAVLSMPMQAAGATTARVDFEGETEAVAPAEELLLDATPPQESGPVASALAVEEIQPTVNATPPRVEAADDERGGGAGKIVVILMLLALIAGGVFGLRWYLGRGDGKGSDEANKRQDARPGAPRPPLRPAGPSALDRGLAKVNAQVTARRWDAALELLTSLKSQAPKSQRLSKKLVMVKANQAATQALAKARKALAAGALKKAEFRLTEDFQGDPQVIRAGVCQVLADYCAEAKRLAVDVQKAKVEQLVGQGRAFIRRGKRSQAIAPLRKAVKLDPTHRLARKLYEDLGFRPPRLKRRPRRRR